MLKSRVSHSVLADSYEAGVEVSKKVNEKVNPKVGIMFSSVEYNQKELINGIKSVNDSYDVVGCTSSAGIITPEGYITNESGFVGMLTLDDSNLVVSCFGAERGSNPRETGRMVARRALKKSGLEYAPDYFFMSASPKEEEEYIKGIQDVIGRVPCFGGSAADNTVEGKWSLFYNDKVFNDGVVVAFFYTDKDINTKYTGAYNETSDMGIITKVKDKRILMEIDGVKALDKYQEWTKKDKESLNGGNLLATTITSPLGVKDRLGDLVAIRHPMNGNSDGSMNIGANLSEGTAIIRMEASVKELIVSASDTLKELKNQSNKPGAYLLIHCGGRRLGIGDEGMQEVYKNLLEEANGVPFLCAFTFGEYGYGDDQSNTTGGLMLSFTAFEK